MNKASAQSYLRGETSTLLPIEMHKTSPQSCLGRETSTLLPIEMDMSAKNFARIPLNRITVVTKSLLARRKYPTIMGFVKQAPSKPLSCRC